ncbi:MAG: 3-deoxy-manno-octulosonate cytidylyltransferase [Thiotrichaceae bacterium]|nr:3-deoxy-manno-octulosonate cytidylyltransferase [Thiotrichaceae bacterium]PCI14301.1 MAG: 3-deoxy-manno-octulosonate cytidylyltransferase [Thiotrichales bacterium]
MGFYVVIPARYASTRLPGKPLCEIAGKTMIQHVYERALESDAEKIIIATDDERIQKVAQGFGAEVCMTLGSHPSGTDRLAEVVELLACSDDQIIVNLQGDEPLMPASLINQTAGNLANHNDASVSTLCEPITDCAELFDWHCVKVAMDKNGYALYFSRSAIPWPGAEYTPASESLAPEADYFSHVGLYGYRTGFIKEYVTWAPCPHETVESLEQLRVLWHGHKIHVGITDLYPGLSIDTQEELAKLEVIMAKRQDSQ